MNIFTAVKYCCILHGRVFVIIFTVTISSRLIFSDTCIVTVFSIPMQMRPNMTVKYVNVNPRSLLYKNNFAVLDSPMMHTKVRVHRTLTSGEEDLNVCTINGHGGHLGHVNRKIYTFCPFVPGFHIWL